MPKKRLAKIFLTLVLALGVCLLAGYIGGYPALSKAPFGIVIDLQIENYLGENFKVFDPEGISSLYADPIVRPIFFPPEWLFSVAWLVSFALMGFTLFFILEAGVRRGEVMLGLILFIAQIFFLFAWAYNFFGGHTMFFALMFAIALLATLLCTVIQISRFSVTGGMLMVPYLLWVIYLVYFTYGIMTLNKFPLTL